MSNSNLTFWNKNEMKVQWFKVRSKTDKELA